MFCSLLLYVLILIYCYIIIARERVRVRVRVRGARTSLDDFALQQRQAEMKITNKTVSTPSQPCPHGAPQLVRLARSADYSQYHLRVPLVATWTANLTLSPSALGLAYFFTTRNSLYLLFSFSRLAINIRVILRDLFLELRHFSHYPATPSLLYATFSDRP
jgi:hypothetical protein